MRQIGKALVQDTALLFDMTPLVTVSIVSPSCATMTHNNRAKLI